MWRVQATFGTTCRPLGRQPHRHGLNPTAFTRICLNLNAIRGEGITANPELRIVPCETNVGIFWNDVLLVSATLLDQKTVHLKIDLRRIGILIYDDNEGLHIGSNVLARTSFANCMTAISLG